MSGSRSRSGSSSNATCSASSRLIVQRGVKDELIKRIVAHAREWPMGDPLDPANRVGALVSKAHFDKVCSYLEKGQKVLLGGKAKDGGIESLRAYAALAVIVFHVIHLAQFDPPQSLMAMKWHFGRGVPLFFAVSVLVAVPSLLLLVWLQVRGHFTTLVVKR